MMLNNTSLYLLPIVPLQISKFDLRGSSQEVHTQGPIPILLLIDPTEMRFKKYSSVQIPALLLFCKYFHIGNQARFKKESETI